MEMTFVLVAVTPSRARSRVAQPSLFTNNHKVKNNPNTLNGINQWNTYNRNGLCVYVERDSFAQRNSSPPRRLLHVKVILARPHTRETMILYCCILG